jgi:hypothetical protein
MPERSEWEAQLDRTLAELLVDLQAVEARLDASARPSRWASATPQSARNSPRTRSRYAGCRSSTVTPTPRRAGAAARAAPAIPPPTTTTSAHRLATAASPLRPRRPAPIPARTRSGSAPQGPECVAVCAASRGLAQVLTGPHGRPRSTRAAAQEVARTGPPSSAGDYEKLWEPFGGPGGPGGGQPRDGLRWDRLNQLPESSRNTASIP